MHQVFKWLKIWLQTFDLLPDYFPAIVRRWHDVLWGAGIVAVGFVLWWFLGNPSVRIIASYLAAVMFIAGYYVWRADHIRLLPKLKFGDARVVKTPTNQPGLERVVAQVLVQCATDASLTDCRGHLLRVLKWSNSDKKWTPTDVDEPLDLLWSIIDEPVRTLQPGIDQQLCIFSIDSVRPTIAIWAARTPFRVSATFERASPNDIFRFDIQVTARDCGPSNISLEVKSGDQWDKPTVRPTRQD